MEGPISSPEFIGREQELAVLVDAASRAHRGEGSFALLAGESGIGKVISDKTASVHVSNILGKLGVRNRVEAASVAHTLGF